MLRVRARWVAGLTLTLATGCGSTDYPDVAYVLDAGVRPLPDAGMDAGASTDGGTDGPAETCGVFAAGVAGWGDLTCGLPSCQVELALAPALQAETLQWQDCDTWGSGCRKLAPPSGDFRAWTHVVGRYTDHGAMLWLESAEAVQLASTTHVWTLTGVDGPAVAVVRVPSETVAFDGGMVDAACGVTAFDVGYANSALEITDRVNGRAVFLRGPNADDPAWQSVFAQTWRPEFAAGGALAASGSEVYLATLPRKLWRFAGGAREPALVDEGYGSLRVYGALQSVPAGLFYLDVEDTAEASVRVLLEGEASPRVIGTQGAGDAGPVSLTVLAASPSTLAWAIPVGGSGAWVFHSPSSTEPGGLLPAPAVSVPTGASEPSIATGFGYVMYCQGLECTVVRLSDGAKFSTVDVHSGYDYTRALWVGPDDVGFATVGYNSSDRITGIYRVAYSALRAQ